MVPLSTGCMSLNSKKNWLPYAHIVLKLADADRVNTVDVIDTHIRAEIPGEDEHVLRNLVLSFMIHTPCSNDPNMSCRRWGNRCRFSFPKVLHECTAFLGEDRYPVYRRLTPSITVRGMSVDNTHVVPYPPTLTILMKCHINVEAHNPDLGVRYLYKYSHKGVDHERDPPDAEALSWLGGLGAGGWALMLGGGLFLPDLGAQLLVYPN